MHGGDDGPIVEPDTAMRDVMRHHPARAAA